MDPAYQACLDRLAHANIHIRSLKRAFRAYVANDACSVETHLDLHKGRPEWAIYAALLQEPPAQLGLLVSDAINDLRGILDNLVWALTAQHSGPPPPEPIPSSGPLAKWRNVHFPCVLHAKDWPSVRGNQLWGVAPRLVADFEALQPYYRRKTRPERDEFAVLNEMWNRDKHRRPGIVVVPIKFAGLVEDKPAVEEAERRLFEVVELDSRPLKGRAEVARIREVLRPGQTRFRLEMDVDFELSFDIFFEKGRPGYEAGVFTTLESLRDAVRIALDQFRAEFP